MEFGVRSIRSGGLGSGGELRALRGRAGETTTPQPWTASEAWPERRAERRSAAKRSQGLKAPAAPAS